MIAKPSSWFQQHCSSEVPQSSELPPQRSHTKPLRLPRTRHRTAGSCHSRSPGSTAARRLHRPAPRTGREDLPHEQVRGPRSRNRSPLREPLPLRPKPHEPNDPMAVPAIGSFVPDLERRRRDHKISSPPPGHANIRVRGFSHPDKPQFAQH